MDHRAARQVPRILSTCVGGSRSAPWINSHAGDKPYVDLPAIALSGLDRAQTTLEQSASRLARAPSPPTPSI